jgi:hypothetical protein
MARFVCIARLDIALDEKLGDRVALADPIVGSCGWSSSSLCPASVFLVLVVGVLVVVAHVKLWLKPWGLEAGGPCLRQLPFEKWGASPPPFSSGAERRRYLFRWIFVSSACSM